MIGRSKHENWIAVIIATVIVVVQFGCDSATRVAETSSNESAPITFDDSHTAKQIFSKMVRTYRNADRYSDRAVLYMSYRLNGRRIQEPQPWAIALDSQGRFAADLFNSKLRCDGKLFSCYVYDIDSGNLDNQRVVIPIRDHLPIQEIYNDEIARHFLSGYAEMPLDESRKTEDPELVPPTIGLLTSMVSPKWLKPDVHLERFEDSDIDGRECFVVRCFQSREPDDHVDLWIDKENSIVLQAALPTSCLDPKVRRSPEIVDLRMVARFHEASFQPKYSPDQFALQARPEATPVSSFVKVPEPLISEMIGMKAPAFDLKTQSGKLIKSTQLKGRPTALMWIAGDIEDPINQLDYLKRSLPENFATIAAVYSDSELANKESGSLAMTMQLNDVARKTKVNFFYDQEMKTSTALGVQAVPSVLVLDQNMKVQFTTSLAEGWENKTKAALERVAQGEDVASDMLADYQDFLEAYHQQLIAKSTAKLLDVRNADSRVFLTSDANATGRISSRKAWSNTQFKQPGNIVVSQSGSLTNIFCFDGWRSIVELNDSGEIVSRQEIDLPENEGVSVLRVAGRNDKKMFALFMPQGKQVHVFDNQWHKVMSYPSKGTSPINDVEYSDPRVLFLATKDGLHMVKIESKQGELIDKTEHVALSRPMMTIVDGKLRNPKDASDFDVLKPWQLTRVKHSQINGMVVLGTARDGGWHALQPIGEDLGWSSSIGPQLFNTTIEPVAVTNESNGVWAIANSNNIVHLFNHDGMWLGDFTSREAIDGVNVLQTGGKLQLLLSTQSGVTNWNIEVKGPKARAASHQR